MGRGRIEELKARLKPKHLLFANNMLGGMTQEEAYANAGYSNRAARRNSSRLMQTNADIAEYVELCKTSASQKACDKLEISEERIMQELARLGFSNMRNYFGEDGRLIPVEQLSEDAAAALTEVTMREIAREGESVVIERKYKIADKKGSLELLGKSNAIQMFTDKVKINEGNPLEFILKRVAAQTEQSSSPLPSGE